jgi:hypothetical protein
VGFEPTISAGERPKTYILDRAATGTGNLLVVASQNELYMKTVFCFFFCGNLCLVEGRGK